MEPLEGGKSKVIHRNNLLAIEAFEGEQEDLSPEPAEEPEPALLQPRMYGEEEGNDATPPVDLQPVDEPAKSTDALEEPETADPLDSATNDDIADENEYQGLAAGKAPGKPAEKKENVPVGPITRRKARELGIDVNNVLQVMGRALIEMGGPWNPPLG